MIVTRLTLLLVLAVPLSGGLKLIFRFYFRDVASCFLQEFQYVGMSVFMSAAFL